MTAVATPPKAAPATSSTQPRSGDQLLTLPLAQLRESKWNPRKHFDPAKLAEMADSLRKGQLAPIIVRPWPIDRERWITTGLPTGITFELGAGARRFRAAPEAGLTGLLAIVRDLDDVAFLELLTIENKQRDDVEPLDEAAGFKMLMEKAGYDVVKLANRIGLSKEYVYGRLKLLNLVPEAKKLLEQKVITAGHAIILARLTPTDQKRAIGDVEEVVDSGEYAAHRVSLLLEEEKRQAERKRWEAARPAILKAVAGKIAAAAAGPSSRLADEVVSACTQRNKPNTAVPRGRTLEDLIRHAAFQLYAEDVGDLAPGYYRHDQALKKIRAAGIDPEKIVDQVVPKPAPEKKQTLSKKAKRAKH